MKGYDILFDHKNKVLGFSEANCSFSFNNELNLN